MRELILVTDDTDESYMLVLHEHTELIVGIILDSYCVHLRLSESLFWYHFNFNCFLIYYRSTFQKQNNATHR